MERLAPFELSLPFIKNIHIYIYTVPYTFNHLVHSNTTLYCIYIYTYITSFLCLYRTTMNFSSIAHFDGSLRFIHRLFPKQVSLQKGATHSEPVVEGPLGGEDIQVPELSGMRLVWRCLEILKKMTAVGFSKIRESLKQFLCQWGYMISILYILKSIQINYNPNVYVSARHRFHHTFSIVYVQIW